MNKVTFFHGEENGIVKEHDAYNDSIFCEQYSQAIKLLDGLVAKMLVDKDVYGKKHSVGLDDMTPNLVAFCGDRGEGKTSCMCSVIDMLKDKKTDNVQEKYLLSQGARRLCSAKLECLSLVNPAFFDHNHNVLELLLGEMYKNFKNASDDYTNSSNLLLKFQEAKLCLKHLDKAKREMYDVIEELDALSAGVTLRDAIAELFEEYLAFTGSDFLVISIDDLDLNMNEAYIMAEQIRKYLSNPFCLVLISVKVDQLMEVVENTISAELEDRSKIDVNDMAVKYVEKLLPSGSRVNMPRAHDLCSYDLELMDNRNDKNLLFPISSVRDCMLRLIFMKTRYLFYNSKGGISPIIPNNLRSLRHVLGMLLNMPDFGGNDVSSNNKRIFKNYFYYTWTKGLSDEHRAIAYRLVHNDDVSQTNKLIVEYLSNLLGKLKESSNSKTSLLISNISDKANYAFNQSTGDVFFLLNVLERNSSDEDVQRLLFFIKSFYSINLYERYDEISEGDIKYLYPNLEVEDKGEVYKSDKWFNQANNLQRLVNGSFFTYNEMEMVHRSTEGKLRDLAIIYGDKLKTLVTSLRDRITHEDNAVLDNDADFKMSFRMLEFFLMNIYRRTQDSSISIDTDSYRSMPIPSHLQSFNVQMGTFLFDVLGAFANVINIKFAYNRFDNAKMFYDFAYSRDWTLLGRMMRLVQLKEAQDENPNAKETELPAISNQQDRENALYRLISNATIRNAEVISAMTESMRFRVDSLKSSSKRHELLREFYSSIINSDMRTYKKNANEPQYIIKFGFLEAFRELLKEVDEDTFESYFTRTVSAEETQKVIIERLFDAVLNSIKKWKKGSSVLSSLRTVPAYNQISDEIWRATFLDDERITKEMFIEKVRTLKEWTL